jgi:hypothetical protein
MNEPQVPTPILPRAHAGIGEVAPPQSIASPCELKAARGSEVPFWLPGWGEKLKHLGWRWVLVVPSLALVAVLVLGLFDSRAWPLLFSLGLKIIIMVCAMPVLLMMDLARTAIKKKNEPFCIHCGYDLVGLPDNYCCPECGRPYTFAVIEEYRRDPHWFIKRWKTHHEIPLADAPFAAGVTKSRRSRDGT